MSTVYEEGPFRNWTAVMFQAQPAEDERPYFVASATGVRRYKDPADVGVSLGGLTGARQLLVFDNTLWAAVAGGAARYAGIWTTVPDVPAGAGMCTHLHVHGGDLYATFRTGVNDTIVAQWNTIAEEFTQIGGVLDTFGQRACFVSDGSALRVVAATGTNPGGIWTVDGASLVGEDLNNSYAPNVAMFEAYGAIGSGSSIIINGGWLFRGGSQTFSVANVVSQSLSMIDDTIIGDPEGASFWEWAADMFPQPNDADGAYPVSVSGNIFTGGAQYSQPNPGASPDADQFEYQYGVLSVTTSGVSMYLTIDDPVNSGVNADARVRSIADANGSVLVGGEFTKVGGVAASDLALYDGVDVEEFVNNTLSPVTAVLYHVFSGTAPVLIDVDDVAIVPATAYSVQATHTGGDPTTYILTGPTGSQVSDSGLVTWTSVGPAAEHVFRLYAANAGGFSVISWTVTVAVDAPIINAQANQLAITGVFFLSNVVTLSQGDPPITFTLISGPAGMTISSTTGRVTWPSPVATGSPYTVTIRATNVLGFDDDSFTLTVI